MIFAEHPLDEAEGVYNAHMIRCGKRTFKKGQVLNRGDLALMGENGLSAIQGARLEAGDVPEDQAALRVAEMILGANIEPHPAKTARCNLYAQERGLLVIDAAAINRINLVSEAVTIATIPPWSIVEPGDIVATIKIIPFAIPQHLLRTIGALAPAIDPPLSVRPFMGKRAALLLTESSFVVQHVIDRSIDATRQRLAAVRGSLDFIHVCAHEDAAIRDAFHKARASGCDLILVAGASVTKDRKDVIPGALTSIGGEVLHFGMPVEPGNMMLLGRFQDVPVLVLPGCARSVRENGVDLILQRLAVGLEVTPEDVMGMGVGGLLERKRKSSFDEQPGK